MNSDADGAPSGYFPPLDGARPVVTTIRNRPVELSVIAVTVLLGVSSLTGIGATTTASTIVGVGGPVRLVWVGGFVLVGLVALSSVLFADPVRSLSVERVGLLPMGLFLLSYSAASAVLLPDGFTIGPLIWLFLAVGVLARAYMIGRDLSRLQRTLRAVAAVRDAEVRNRDA